MYRHISLTLHCSAPKTQARRNLLTKNVKNELQSIYWLTWHFGGWLHFSEKHQIKQNLMIFFFFSKQFEEDDRKPKTIRRRTSVTIHHHIASWAGNPNHLNFFNEANLFGQICQLSFSALEITILKSKTILNSLFRSGVFRGVRTFKSSLPSSPPQLKPVQLAFTVKIQVCLNFDSNLIIYTEYDC